MLHGMCQASHIVYSVHVTCPHNNKGSPRQRIIASKENSFDSFIIKKKKKSVQPTRSNTCDNVNSLYVSGETDPPTHPPTYLPTYVRTQPTPPHRLFDCSDGDFWLRTWVAPPSSFIQKGGHPEDEEDEEYES